jgi:amino acid adenylation domain-containing protein
MTAHSGAPTIPRRSDHGPAPLSFPQERLFLLDRIMPGLAAYNVPTLVRVRGRLRDELLRRACEIVVERHEILRTAIVMRDGEPLQEVLTPGRFELTAADLSAAASPEQARAEAQALLGELAGRPFDLGGDVLLRVGLVHLPGDEDLLLVVFHHASSDHVSSAVLFSELDAIYAALERGLEPRLPELPIQYADYAVWQRSHLAGDELAELLEYWTHKLAGARERLDLPADHPRPSAQSYRGALCEFRLDAAAVAPLRELARRERVSLFMVLLAAFKTLLHRYTGAEDIVVGAPVSGRRLEELTPLLGYFSNTLALRTDLSGDPTFSELLMRVRETVLEGQVYGELPFEKLVEALNPQRSQSHSPIFQVLFGFDVMPAEGPRIAGLALEPLPIPGWQWSRFDLSIVLRDQPDGTLSAQLEYATDLFEPATIDRFVGQLQTLLTSAAADPGRHLSELEILPSTERRLLLEEWNRTAVAYDRRCLHELFAEQAARAPTAIAVQTAEELLSYGELDTRSNRLAAHLRGLGVEPGGRVGVCLDRGGALVVALLAVLKTGAAYVPIEPSYPPQRQELMLADSGARVLVTQERYSGILDGGRLHVVDVDRDAAAIAAASGDPLGVELSPEAVAYLIYTSGSTGQPKGVEIRHRSVANLMAYMRDRPGLGPGEVLANLTTPAFDLSVPDWYLPLTTGARLVIVPREATLDGVELADWLARVGATFVQATPTTWQMLVDAGWTGSPELKIVCGGEALSRALAEELLRRGSALWHMYGPTETTVWSSILPLRPADGPVPIGGPIANTSFFVVDGHGQPVPVGVPGELWIGGEGVARGYHARAELTAERFIEAELVPGRPERVYRTGDLVRWRPAGTLEFLGRIDQQVKLRGFRIELGEIEAVLDSHPAVAGSVAVVREDQPGDQRLIAYLVAAEAGPVEAEALRRLCKGKLPPFMVPSAFVVLDAFPVTANGKLDRRALPAPDGSRASAGGEYVAPETPMQEAVADIFGEVLGLRRVGLQDDFFDLGGHSLLAVKMLARVQERLGLTLPLGTVFEHSTVRGLADAIGSELLGATDEDELAALLSEIEGVE